MTEKETKQLEKLLGKLSTKLNNHRVCVITGYIHDGYHVAQYAHDGEKLSEKSGPTIWSIIRQVDAGI